MRGHPVLGVVTGLLFGIFVALDLIFFGVMASDSILVLLLPLLGLLLGVGLAAWAPLGGRHREPAIASPGPDEPPPPADRV